MREVEIPRARPGSDTRAYSLEEEVRMLAILPEPAASVVAVAAFTGARKVKFVVSSGKAMTASL
jgi:hypothetical protein